MTERERYAGWTIIELFGHRRLAGYVEEVELAGGAFLRLDVHVGEEEEPRVTQFYGASAVYCLTPTTAALARAFAERSVPRPVARFELPPPDVPAEEEQEAIRARFEEPY